MAANICCDVTVPSKMTVFNELPWLILESIASRSLTISVYYSAGEKLAHLRNELPSGTPADVIPAQLNAH